MNQNTYQGNKMDIITHVTKLDRFRDEAVAQAQDENAATGNLFTIDESGSLNYNANKIPVFYNGNESLCLIRIKNDSALQHLTYLKRLGECINKEYIFDTDADKATFDRIYDSEPRMIDDGNGGQIEYTPPPNIGVFA